MIKFIFQLAIIPFSAFFFFIHAIPTNNLHPTLINNLFARDKSPNPAAISYSGCGLKGKLNCSSHTDLGIQIGECWSNSRVMEQKSAFFTPVQKNDPSYYYEGGPYGTCSAFACYPNQDQLQPTQKLEDFCFFWDGKDHTIARNGGLYFQLRRQFNRLSIYRRYITCRRPYISWMTKCLKREDDESPSGSGLTKRSPKDKKEKGENGKDDQKALPDYVPNVDGGNGQMPKAPGSVVIPIPMICPSNLRNCYAQTYFEQGGKLQVYANVKPTYQGDWFPPKNLQRQPMFCNGLNRGCPTPTMQQLQLQHLAQQHCEVSQCKN